MWMGRKGVYFKSQDLQRFKCSFLLTDDKKTKYFWPRTFTFLFQCWLAGYILLLQLFYGNFKTFEHCYLLEGWRWGVVKLERWVAKSGRRRLSQGDGWLSWYLVVHLLATAVLWVRIQISLKNTKWETYKRSGHTLARPKSIQYKNICLHFKQCHADSDDIYIGHAL